MFCSPRWVSFLSLEASTILILVIIFVFLYTFTSYASLTNMVWFYLFLWTLYERNHTIHILLFLASSPQHGFIKSHPRGFVSLKFILSSLLYCTPLSITMYLSTPLCIGMLQFGAMVNNTAINIPVHGSDPYTHKFL